MSDDLPLYHVVISDPPSKFTIRRKKEKEGKGIEDVYYLTANIFYGDLHWAIRWQAVNYAKDWIKPFLEQMPKLEKCRIEITYHHNTDGFDLDNKAYFWIKIILDLMKTPTSDEIIEASKKNRTIKTINVIYDDSVKYVDEIIMRYKRGAPAIELRITGRLLSEQQNLF